MKTLDSFEQGSEEWKAARAGKVTASRAKDARDKLKSGAPSQKQLAYAYQLAVERISKAPADMVFENWQMREGRAQEPRARAAYEAQTGAFVDEVGAFSTDDDLFLYSPDGVIGEQGLLEVKSLFSPERIVSIVAHGDTSEFEDQCNFGLWLTGREWIDLVIWAPAVNHMSIKRITRNEEAIETLEADMLAFAKTVKTNEDALRKALGGADARTANLS